MTGYAVVGWLALHQPALHLALAACVALLAGRYLGHLLDGGALSTLEAQVRAKNEDISTLRSDLEFWTRCFNDADERLDAKEADYAILERRAIAAGIKASRLTQVNEELEQALDDANAACKVTAEDVAAWKRWCEVARHEAAELRGCLVTYRDRLRNQASTIQTYQQQLRDAANRIAEPGVRVSNLRRDNEELSKGNVDLTRQLNRELAHGRQVDVELQVACTERDAARADKAVAEKDASDLRTRVNELTVQVGSLVGKQPDWNTTNWFYNRWASVPAGVPSFTYATTTADQSRYVVSGSEVSCQANQTPQS